MAATPLPEAGDLDLADVAIYPHWTREILRFSDTDAFGHVNNGSFATCFENARIKLIQKLGPDEREQGRDWVLARLCIDFRAQLFYPGEVEVGTRVMRIGTSSFAVAQGLFSDGSCRGVATAAMVLIDLASGTSRPISEALRAKITTLLS